MKFYSKGFFKALDACLDGRYNLSKWVAETLNCSESNAWRKIKGERNLSIDELLQLIASKDTLAIKAAELYTKDNLKVVQIRGFSNVESFHAYLQTILQMLNEASKQSDFRFRYMARDLPLFYFLGAPEVLRFKFHLWAPGSQLHHEILPASTLSLAHDLYQCYLSINTEEIWYQQAFAHQYDQLHHLQALGVLHAHQVETLTACFQQMEGQLQVAQKRGVKAKGGELLAAFCPMALYNNAALLYCKGQEQLMGSTMNTQYYYSFSPSLIEPFNRLWTQHLNYCHEAPRAMHYRDMRYQEEQQMQLAQKG